jgi:hypothetical protein
MSIGFMQVQARKLDQTNSAFQGGFGLSPSFLPSGKAGGRKIRRCQGFAVAHYGFTLGALTLAPSDFCNIGVCVGPLQRNHPIRIDKGVDCGRRRPLRPEDIYFIFEMGSSSIVCEYFLRAIVQGNWPVKICQAFAT